MNEMGIKNALIVKYSTMDAFSQQGENVSSVSESFARSFISEKANQNSQSARDTLSLFIYADARRLISTKEHCRIRISRVARWWNDDRPSIYIPTAGWDLSAGARAVFSRKRRAEN